MKRVAITGMAVGSPFGPSLEAFWKGVLTTAAPRARLPDRGLVGLSVQYAPILWPQDPGGPVPRRALAGAGDVLGRALADAGFDAAPDGAGLGVGSHFAETDALERPLPPPEQGVMLDALAAAFGFTGPVANTPIGCAAGNLALAWALDRLRQGEAPVMVAGGFDLIGAAAAGVFDAMGNLSPTQPRPFDARRDGFLLGEGGAYFVLEPWEAAVARGARIHAELLGAGVAHDADSPVRPASDGRGLVSALRSALAEAGVTPREVGYVNAHAPGTLANDPGEAAAYVTVFGARGVPVSSTKASLGHAQGGANGLEAAACVLALQRQLLPPTMGTTPDEGLGLDVVHGAPRAASLEVAVSSASGMGGANAVVVLRKAP